MRTSLRSPPRKSKDCRAGVKRRRAESPDSATASYDPAGQSGVPQAIEEAGASDTARTQESDEFDSRKVKFPNRRATGSYRDFDDFLHDRARNGFVVFFQAMKIPLNRIPDIRHGLVAGFALGNATGQHRAFRHEHPVLVRFNHDSEFHGVTVAVSAVIRD